MALRSPPPLLAPQQLQLAKAPASPNNGPPSHSPVSRPVCTAGNSMIEGAARSESKDDEEEHSMTFQLGEGEEEEASSLVPLSVDVNGGGRLNRWSLKYLTENSERGVGKIVGGGSFANVAVVTLASGNKMAVKSINRFTANDECLDDFIDMEVRSLQAAGPHPNVVNFLGFVRTSVRMFMMMPMVATDLEAMIEVTPLSEHKTLFYMGQLVAALEYLHVKGIVHRDIKPANMLITKDDVLQLADFGISTIIPPGQTCVADLACGTKSYMSPEQLVGEGEELEYSTKVDMWGLGVVTFELLHQRTPFRPVVSSTGGLGYGSCGGNGGAGAEETKGSVADDTWQRQGIELTYQDEVDIQERENILTAPVVFDERLVGAECQDFILKLLERDVEKRVPASEAAEHPWLGGIEAAAEIRAEASAAVAARENELRAEKARLMVGKRRVVRRRIAQGA